MRIATQRGRGNIESYYRVLLREKVREKGEKRDTNPESQKKVYKGAGIYDIMERTTEQKLGREVVVGQGKELN